MDGRRFDAFTKFFVAAPASRRRVVGGLVTGGMTLLVARPGETYAARRCKKGNFCRTNGVRICDPDDFCVCYKRAGGGHVCAAPGGDCVSCRRDRDCRRAGLPGYHCVENGRNCCGGRRQAVCAAPCGTAPPCDGVTCNDVCCDFEQACVGDPGVCAACPVGGNLCAGNPVSCDPFGDCSCVTSIEDVAVCSSLFGFCVDCDSDDQCSLALGEQAVCIPAPDCCSQFAATRACVPATCFGGGPIGATPATSVARRHLRPLDVADDVTPRRSFWPRPA